MKRISKTDFTNKKVEEGTKLEKSLMMSLQNMFLTQLKFAFADN